MASLSHPLDLCIIGGGINGAGIALDAARRGLRVALYEQHDFGFGASSATSKLAHGGLRYLEQFKFNLVKESLNERNYLLNRAPHLVKPLQFYVPMYKGSKWKPWALKMGLTLYDWMQTKRPMPAHCMLGKQQLKANVPWLKTDGLVGCGSYFDAQMDDHRLIIELLMMANQEGAMIQNYTKVTNLQATSSGASMELHSHGIATGNVSASSVIVATGAWNNQFSRVPIVKPTKGVHIVLPDMDLSVALLLLTPKDHRVFFMMPWQGKTLVGTTDQMDDQHYDSPVVNSDEVHYLLDAVNAYHEHVQWGLGDVVSSFCGYRPLVHTNESIASKQTREDTYIWLDKPILSVNGGKYTTYRLMAERAVNLIQSNVFQNRVLTKSDSKNLNFIGHLPISEWPSEAQLTHLSNQYHIQRDSILHIIGTYGALYKQILNTISYQKACAIRFDIGLPVIVAELKYAISNEWVKTVDDFLFRRTYYGYIYQDHHEFLNAIALKFNQLTGTSESVSDQIQRITQRATYGQT